MDEETGEDGYLANQQRGATAPLRAGDLRAGDLRAGDLRAGDLRSHDAHLAAELLRLARQVYRLERDVTAISEAVLALALERGIVVKHRRAKPETSKPGLLFPERLPGFE